MAEINPKFTAQGCDGAMEVSFLPMKAVEERTGKIDPSQRRMLRDVQKRYTSFSDGDILFAKITPCMENGKVAIAKNLNNGIGFGSTEFHVIRVRDVIKKELLLYFLLQDDYRKAAQRSMTGSAGQLRVPASFIESTVVPLPPPREQQRIVAKIEELFTNLDAGVDGLKKVKAQLKRYRQAVLRYAFEGNLTQDWREANKGKVEPASALLERTRANSKAAGSRNNLGLPRADMPDLPDGWCWTLLPQLGELARGKSKHRPRDDQKLYVGPYPFIQTGDVRNSNGRIRKFTQTYSEAGLAQSRLWPAGTLCITIAANIADSGILTFQSCFPDSIVGFVAQDSCCDVRFIELFIRTAKENLERYAPATAQKNINLDALQKLAVPLPPLEEQHEIVEEVESRLSVADQVEIAIDQSLKQSDRLRQSILKKAFEGRLVPQDPNDEPAEKLLGRIRQEKAKVEPRGNVKNGARCQRNAIQLELI